MGDAITSDEVARQVDLLLQRRRVEQARSLLKPALQNDPDHVGLMLLSAWTEYLDDRYDEAAKSVQQVLAVSPDNASARLLHFELCMEQDRYPEAERVIIELLRDYPEEADYYGRYAKLMLQTLNFHKAGLLAREGLRYEPDDMYCLSIQTICDFIERRHGATSASLQQLIVQYPQAAGTLRLVVIALVHKGEYRAARRLSQELVQHYPGDSSIVDLARSLKIETHWSMLPLWPMRRFGWGASVAIWLAMVLGWPYVAGANPTLGLAVLIVFLTYAVYSWVWPPLLRRIVGT